MATLGTADPVAVAVVTAIHRGDVAAPRRLLAEHPGLAASRFGDDDPDGMSRTLLHVVTDWPGHFPHGGESVAALVVAGADVNARFRGPHGETPLHWAASSDDIEVLDALLDAGADIEAPGAVIAGGPPLADATAFAQWKAARRLVERGAQVNLHAAASLGLMVQLDGFISGANPSDPAQVSDAFWAACHGCQRPAAAYLLDHGAALNWLPAWEELTPLDAAASSGATDVITWLHGRGARTASELRLPDRVFHRRHLAAAALPAGLARPHRLVGDDRGRAANRRHGCWPAHRTPTTAIRAPPTTARRAGGGRHLRRRSTHRRIRRINPNGPPGPAEGCGANRSAIPPKTGPADCPMWR